MVCHGGFLKGDLNYVLESLSQEQFDISLVQGAPNTDAIRKVGLGSSCCKE